MATPSDFGTSVRLKIERAHVQAAEIASSIQQWTASNPVRARCELRDERLGFRLIMEPFTDKPPTEEWALRFGECIHNLRSSLDNLVFALARTVKDPPPKPKSLAFPIYQFRNDFEKNGWSKISQLPEAAAELVHKMQPFQRDGTEQFGKPEEDPLLMLQRLSNTDKHQLPPVALLAPTSIEHSCAIEFHSDEDAAANVPPVANVWAAPLEPGVILLEHFTTRPVKHVHGKYEGSAIVAVHDNERFQSLPVVLASLSNHVALVYSQFHPLLVQP